MCDRIRRIILGIVWCVLGCGFVAALPGCHAAPKHAAEAWYEPEIRAFEAADRASPPAPGQILFIGSSSFRLWKTLPIDMAPLPIINRGFGGAKTPDVLAVFDRVVPACRPSIVVYYCGDNDLGIDNTDIAPVVNNFIAFDRRVQALWPGTRVFYVSIKASVQRWKNWPAMKAANDTIRAYCERTPGRGFLDVAQPMLNADGVPDPSLFEADGLHVNAAGYAKWTAVVRPALLSAWKETQRSP
ncbi:MAG: GDSL-type esterase/lipase family protein [Planctomycetota bacterium]|nr:GDSL-type esterase/lipase family protein [Planctomycetota bacterium]